MNTKTLDQAVMQLKQGSTDAFDVIYELTSTKVYYTILSIIKDPSLAEDIMQDTYIKMLEALPSYRRNKNYLSWLLTIAKNQAINTYNRRKKEFLVDVDEHPNMFGSIEANQEKGYQLTELLDVLNDDEKTVVMRHVILGEKHKDIAKVLDKPLGTITWMYQNALTKMRKKAGDDNA